MIPIRSHGVLRNDVRCGSDHLGPQGLVEASRITPYVTLHMLTDAGSTALSQMAQTATFWRCPPVTDSPTMEVPCHPASCTKRQRL